MSTGCERGKNDMQPSYQSCDTSNNNNMNGILNKSHVSGLGEAHSSLLSEIHAPFLSISPMLAFTNSYIDLPVDSACNQLEVLDSVGSPLQYGLNEDLYLDQCSPITGWNRCLDLGLDTDQNLEDVFTASKECLGDGPTLAALNASDKSVLDDLELEELSLPEEISSQIRSSGIPTPTQDSQDSLSIQLVCNVTAPNVDLPVARSQSAAVRQETPTEIPKHSTLHDLLVQNRTPSPVTLQNQQPGSRLDIKVEPVSPAESYYEHHHQLQPEQPSYGRPTAITALNSDSFADQTVVDGGNSAVSEFVESIKSEVTDNESHDEGFDSELDESDHCNDECSDVESLSSLDLSRNSNSPVTLSKARKKERYFWQYNLQAKGPKGNRMPLSSEALDPHMLDEITDPVFSPTCQVKGIKHTGKARRGDGNDLTPNPTKLYQIGQELKELNKVINDLTPVSDLPFNVRSKSRKEKNKLASRACRLKKKAQHEANKLKLYGLEQEHRRLMYVISEMKRTLMNPSAECLTKRGGMYQQCEDLTHNFLKTKVAGHTVDYVNAILEKVSSGAYPALLDQF